MTSESSFINATYMLAVNLICCCNKHNMIYLSLYRAKDMGRLIIAKCNYCQWRKTFQMVKETHVKIEQTESLCLEMVKVKGDTDTIQFEDIIKTRYYDSCPCCDFRPLTFLRMVSC